MWMSYGKVSAKMQLETIAGSITSLFFGGAWMCNLTDVCEECTASIFRVKQRLHSITLKNTSYHQVSK
jgi:hypothetical protein